MTKDLCAAIDIGSNTIRLIIGEYSSGKLRVATKELRITRLGKGFHHTGEISEESAEKSLRALTEYSNIIKQFGVTSVAVCATAVMRKAKNAARLVDDIKKQTELDVRVISGDTEARLSALGVSSTIQTRATSTLLFDVGGGSTEFIFSHGNTVEVAMSLPIGVVVMYESFIKNDPPLASELDAMNAQIRQAIINMKGESFSAISDNFDIVFTAGTATTLAAIKLNMGDYDPDVINNYVVTYDEVKSLYNDFILKTNPEREKIIGLEKGREDIIIPGALIALNVMDIFGVDAMVISDASLLEGILIDHIKKNT